MDFAVRSEHSIVRYDPPLVTYESAFEAAILKVWPSGFEVSASCHIRRFRSLVDEEGLA